MYAQLDKELMKNKYDKIDKMNIQMQSQLYKVNAQNRQLAEELKELKTGSLKILMEE